MVYPIVALAFPNSLSSRRAADTPIMPGRLGPVAAGLHQTPFAPAVLRFIDEHPAAIDAGACLDPASFARIAKDRHSRDRDEPQGRLARQIIERRRFADIDSTEQRLQAGQSRIRLSAKHTPQIAAEAVDRLHGAGPRRFDPGAERFSRGSGRCPGRARDAALGERHLGDDRRHDGSNLVGVIYIIIIDWSFSLINLFPSRVFKWIDSLGDDLVASTAKAGAAAGSYQAGAMGGGMIGLANRRAGIAIKTGRDR